MLGNLFKGAIGTNRLRYTVVEGWHDHFTIYLYTPISFLLDIIPHVLLLTSHAKEASLLLPFPSFTTSPHDNISCQGEVMV